MEFTLLKKNNNKECTQENCASEKQKLVCVYIYISTLHMHNIQLLKI